MNKAVVGAAATVVVVAGALLLLEKHASDEEPIIVKGGSIHIVPGGGGNEYQWAHETGDNFEPGVPSYSHEPKAVDFDREKDLSVKVFRNQGQCANGDTASGNIVQVDYTESGSTSFRFRRARSGFYNYRTKVRPDTPLTLQGVELRSGQAGSGFISAVRVGSWSCTFASAADLKEIAICAGTSHAGCQ